jgi:hypothetical protein
MRRRLSLSALVSTLAVASSFFVFAPPASANSEVPVGTVAYVAPVNGHRAIFTIDIADPYDNRVLVDLGDRDAAQPAWSVDGTRLGFTAETTPGGPTAIFVANSDGSGVEQVTSPGPGESDSDPSWSPTGNEIVFGRTLSTGLSKIFIVEVTTRDLRVLDFPSLPSTAQPDWSPDGQQIAFVAREYVDPSICEAVPEVCSWKPFVGNADGTGSPRRLESLGLDFHDPDWSPNGTQIAAWLSIAGDPASIVGLVIDVASGGVVADTSGPVYESSWSPSGHLLIGRLGSTDPFLLIYDELGNFIQFLVSPGSEPAWGVAPPPPDTSPPVLEFRPDPLASEWLPVGFAGYVSVVATDDQSLPTIECTNNGSALNLITGQVGSSMKAVAKLPEGVNLLVCTATDAAGNSATASAKYRVDLSPPEIGGPVVTPTVAKIGETVSVSATVTDAGSDLRSVSFEVLGTAPEPTARGPMTGSGSAFTASFVPSGPDLSTVVVEASDDIGFVARSAAPFVSYDPSAGSAAGTGWIVPGGSTSDPGDVLPGLDGVEKASFSFTAKYKASSSTVPAGSLTFSFGSHFKLQSRDLSWLAVPGADLAYFGGLASIQGMEGAFPFVATITDGGSTGGSDRFDLRVYEPGTNIASEVPLFAASGTAGGQIQIRPS